MARVFAFRGRRAGLIKLVWHDGIGLCMLTKRLEHGQFVWPSASHRADRAVGGAAGGVARGLRVAGAGRAACGRNWQGERGGLFELAPTRRRCSSSALCRSILTPCRTTPPLCSRCVRDAAAAQHDELHAENDKLRLLIQRLLRHRFGRRSEQLTPDQLQFGAGGPRADDAENQAGQEAATAPAHAQAPARHAAARNHGALPAHLPRYEVVIDVEDQRLPVLRRRAARHRRTAHRAARHRARAAAGASDPAPALCLPRLRGGRGGGSGTGAADRWRHGRPRR